jgi:hypothetical protein
MKLTELAKEVENLNEKMHAEIVKFLKEHNRLVRTDRNETKSSRDDMPSNIYVISMDSGELNTEKRVLAVAIFEDEQVAVLPAFSDNETINGMTDQEVLDCDDWEWINDGFVLQNATLWSICENIEEYV